MHDGPRQAAQFRHGPAQRRARLAAHPQAARPLARQAPGPHAFEQLLRKHTWFTVGATLGNGQVNTIEEGLVARYGIEACLLEFNPNWIEAANAPASAELWQQFARDLRDMFLDYVSRFAPAGER